jgi:hypothetical protein
MEDITIIIEKKPRGRPKKIITELTEPLVKEKKQNGRPKKYFTDEERKQAKKSKRKKTYNEREIVYSKIVSLKKNYDLSYPNKEDILNKTLEELNIILKQIINDVEEIKKKRYIQKHTQTINNLIDEVNKKNFKPYRKEL